MQQLNCSLSPPFRKALYVYLLLVLFPLLISSVCFSQPPPSNLCRNSLLFDGVDDHLTTSVSAFDYGSGTFEVWVKKANWSSANDEVLLGNGIANNTDNCIYFSIHPSVGLHFRYGGYPNQVGNTYASSGLSAITSLSAGSWHHIAATWNYSNPTTTIIVYLDGVQVGTSTTNLLITSTNNLFFGKNPSAYFFGGEMAELRLWNVAKSSTAIASAKDNILIGNETNLIGYWPLTEPSGATAANLVAGGNVATLTNMNTATAWTNIPKAGCSAQTITFNAFNNPNLSGTPITPSASASSGLSLTYSSSNTAVATVSGNTISPLTVGSTTIQASQPGNSSYYPAVPLEQNFDVKGLFTSYFSLAGPYHNRSVMGDFDKDGDLDFFIANSSRQSPTTCYSNGTTGAMGPITGNGQYWWRSPEITWNDRTAIGLSDFNKDGNLDIMIGGVHYERDVLFSLTDINYAYSSALWFGGYAGFPYELGQPFQPLWGYGLQTNVTSIAQGNAAYGDYDNDGNDDMLLTGFSMDPNYDNFMGTFAIGHTRIWHNMGNSFPSPQINRDGNNNFTDQTSTMAPSLPDVNGAVALCDYDNDGDLDFLNIPLVEFANSTFLINGPIGTTVPRVFEIWRNGTTGANGVFTDQTSEIAPSAISVGYGTTIAWGDYDNDGDMDFVLSGSDKTALFRNGTTGAMGTFTDQTATIAPSLATFKSEKGSIVWGDYDNDGDLDLLLTGNSGKIFQNGTTGATGTFTDQTMVLLGAIDNIKSVQSDYYFDNSSFQESVGYNSGTWGDIDNDGDLDILITGKTANLYKNGTTAANTAPSVPTGLVPTLSGTTVTFNWTASTDNTTPSVALTYNVRVSTTSGGRDVVSPNALNSGFLTTPAWGNAGQGTNFILKNLTPGTTYYWTVQAIDNGLLGSAFATEGSFCVPPAAPTGLASQTFCNAATVANLAATGTSIKWYAAATGGTALTSITALSNGATYYATQTTGCENPDRLAVAITIEAQVPIPSITQPTCALSTGTITVIAQNTGDETYSFNNGVSFQSSNSLAGLTAGDYNVVIKSTSGCTSSAALAKVNTQPATPSVPVIASITQPTCSVATGTITVTAQNAGETYSFDNGSTFQASNLKSGLVAGSYNLVIKSMGGCSSTAAQAAVDALPGTPAQPTISVDNSNPEIPILTSSTGTTYQWYKNDVAISGAISSAFTVTEDGAYTVVVFSSNGCASVASVAKNIVISVTSTISASNASSIKFYPNPAKDKLIVVGLYEQTNVSVVSVTGTIMQVNTKWNGMENGQEVLVGDLKTGLYLLLVHNGQGYKSLTFMKE